MCALKYDGRGLFYGVEEKVEGEQEGGGRRREEYIGREKERMKRKVKEGGRNNGRGIQVVEWRDGGKEGKNGERGARGGGKGRKGGRAGVQDEKWRKRGKGKGRGMRSGGEKKGKGKGNGGRREGETCKKGKGER